MTGIHPGKYLTSHLEGVKYLLDCNHKSEDWILTAYLSFYRNVLSYWDDIKHIGFH